MKYCDNCGKALRDTALFCTGCGMPCEEDEEVAAENYQIDETERKNRVLTIVLIVLIVLIIGAAIALTVSLTSGKKADSEETTTVQPREITEYAIETATEAPVTEAQLQPLEPTTMPVVSPTQGSISINNSQAGDSIDRNCYLTVQTEGGNLNMRSGPGSDYNIIAAIPNKTNLFVKECCSNWSLVEYNGKQGWVSTEYLDLGV